MIALRVNAMLAVRSKERELIDLGPEFYTPEEYQDCLKKLFKVSQYLGFLKSSVQALTRFPADASVIDVGCGGGLFLLTLSQYFPKMRLLGIDVSTAAITSAELAKDEWKKKHPSIQVEFQLQPAMTLNLAKNSVDIVLTTLVCHHMDDEDLIGFLQNAHQAARCAVIINDLHRHPIAYGFYKLFSPLLFRNRLITHDGLISIKRSFTRADLKRILSLANIAFYKITWCFPFRWQVILWKT